MSRLDTIWSIASIVPLFQRQIPMGAMQDELSIERSTCNLEISRANHVIQSDRSSIVHEVHRMYRPNIEMDSCCLVPNDTGAFSQAELFPTLGL